MKKITIDDKIKQEIKELVANNEFVAEVEDIRKRVKKFNHELGDISQEEFEHMDWPFSAEAEKLAEKYGLSPLGFLHFQSFVFTGKFNEEIDSEAARFYLNPYAYFSEPSVKNQYLSIQIHRLTTLEDIRAAWPRIQSYFKKGVTIKKRIKIKKNLDRNLEIQRLKNEGKKTKDIVKIINDKYGCDISYQYISRLLARLKTKDI